MSDFTQAPKKVILDLINAANEDLNLVESEVTFGTPSVEEGQRDTSLVLTATAGGRFLGPQTVYYNRLDMAAVFATKSTIFDKDQSVTTIAHVIALINARYAINLTDDDFTSTAFPTWEMIPNEEHTVTLTAKADSLIFTGTGTVTLHLPQVALSDALTANTLDGLSYTPPA